MSIVGHVFAYQVTDHPGAWLRVIAPADTLESLAAALLEKFRDRLTALRAESDPDVVMRISHEAHPAPQRSTRHRWRKLAPHEYRCERCAMTKRRRIDPDTTAWFATLQPPGGTERRAPRMPPCPGQT